MAAPGTSEKDPAFLPSGARWSENVFALYRVAFSCCAGTALLFRAIGAPGATRAILFACAVATIPLALGWRRLPAAGILVGLAGLAAPASVAREPGLLGMAFALLMLVAAPSRGPALAIWHRAAWVILWGLSAGKGAVTLAALGLSGAQSWSPSIWPDPSEPLGFSAACAVAVLELLFVPLCGSARGARAGWVALAIARSLMLFSPDHRLEALGFLALHGLTFQPSWIPAKAIGAGPVLFFDGVCNLCNRLVDFVLAEDHAGAFRLASLQGRAASARRISSPDGGDTVVLLVSDRALVRSDAIVALLAGLGGPWRVLSWLLARLPRALRDAGYRAVASRRYRWFGKRDGCRIPTEAERDRILE